MNKRLIASNLLALAAGQITTWLISTLHLVLVSRYLGVDLAGKLGQAGLVVSMLGLATSLGMEGYIGRTVARAPERGDALTSAALLIRAVLTLPAVAILIFYIHTAPHFDDETRMATYFMVAGLLIGQFGGPFGATFGGRERMAIGAVGAIVGNALDLLLVLIVMRLLHGGVVAFSAIGVVLSVIGLGMTLNWARGYVRPTWRVSRADVRELLAGSLPFWLGGVAITFYSLIDGVLLGNIAGDHAVGLYQTAQRMCAAAFFFPGIVGAVTYPLLARLGIDAGSDYYRVGNKTLSLLIAGMIPLTLGLATFALPLISTVFGHKYDGAIPVLVVLCVGVPFTFLDMQFSQMLSARNKQGLWTAILAASCVLNPLLNLVTIPYAMTHGDHDGAMGAAVAVVITEALMTVYGVALLRGFVLNRVLGRVAAGALVAGAAQGAVVWAASALSVWPPLAQTAGLAAYIALALALGVVAREDVSYLWETAIGGLRTVRARLPRAA